MNPAPQFRVIQAGLGPIGLGMTRALVAHGAFRVVGALDLDRSKSGRDLGEVAGGAPLGVVVTHEPALLEGVEAEVALVTTVSSLERAQGVLLWAIESGWNVVSTCEELSCPWRTHPRLAGRIDEAARSRQVTVLGTGINPGFLMDFLPLSVTGVCLEVRHLAVERIQDAAGRRLPFQRKIGAGLTPAQFEQQVDEGRLRHVGLTESMHLVARSLGWDLERSEDLIEPVLASSRVSSEKLTIEAGQVLGVEQRGRAFCQGREVISLLFRATVGEKEPRDLIRIEGRPGLEVRIPGGVNGDLGTCAVTVNSIARVVAAPAGLKTMADLPPPHCFSLTSPARLKPPRA